ncbi:MAG: 30S ribosomal protein S2 [Patescibacteria group bacterium]
MKVVTAETGESENSTIERLFKAGVQYAYSKSRRHPSISPFIFGSKNRVEIFNLETVFGALSLAKEFVKSLGKERKVVLIVGGKQESRDMVEKAADAIGMPRVAGRFIGGTLTNFVQIRKRIEKLEKFLEEKESGELNRYTKKERLLIDREITRLIHNFGGIRTMKALPSALIVIDSKRENIAVKEAKDLKIPVIALLNSDCNLKEVNYPVPGNDSLKSSISIFLDEMVQSYKEGLKSITSSPEIS